MSINTVMSSRPSQAEFEHHNQTYWKIPFLTVGELIKSNVFGLHKPKHSFLFRLTYLIYEGHY